MRDDELDRILGEEEIVPSAGFVASVMDAVYREAAAPSPLPFPWKQALPGLLGIIVTLSGLIYAIVWILQQPVLPDFDFQQLMDMNRQIQSSVGDTSYWCAVATLASIGSLFVANRFLAERD
jgi:hypothetical protein